MLLVYSSQITERLKYIANHIFTEIWNIDYKLCNDITEFQQYNGEKLSYGFFLEGVPYIANHSLLFEENIHEQNLKIIQYQDFPVIFHTQTEDLLGFDIFAACFYCLSRYEEYLPHQTDEIGRFKPENSWVFIHKFLDKALVDRWIYFFEKKLTIIFPHLKIKKKQQFTFIPTYDIDIAYCYKNKGFFLSIAGALKQILHGKYQDFRQRIKVLTNKQKDPYDNFDYLESLHEKYNIQAIYFVLAAKKRNKYDKNISIQNSDFQNLIQKIAQKNEIGLHSSFQSSIHANIRKNEITYLSAQSKQIIKSNRQHYLCLRFPNTYNQLIFNEIYADFSLGYSQQIGFRASTCSSFLFFDLEKNHQTSLRIYPLFCMENQLRNLGDEQKISSVLFQMVNEYKQFGGTIVSLFHNQSFNKKEPLNWRKIYEDFLEFVLSSN